jgi:integrase
MARLKQKYRFDEKRGVVRAKFYDLVEVGERPPEIQLCTIANLVSKATARGLKKRTEVEKSEYLSQQYIKRLNELRTEKKAKPKKTEAETIKFSQLIERYKRDILPELSASSQRSISHQLKWWNTRGGNRTLSQITAPWILDQRSKLKKEKNATSTVNRYLAALSVVLSACVKEYNLIQLNPAQNVRKLKEPPGRVRYLSEKELSALMQSVNDNDDLMLAVLLALTTGGRQMEVLKLKRDDIDLKNGFVTFTKTKTGNDRTVPIRGEALELLRKRTPRIDTQLIFPDERIQINRLIFAVRLIVH